MATFTTSDGVAIRYEVRGVGPLLAVCHGGPNNLCDTAMRDLVPLEDSFTLLFHDYRGSGGSAAAPAGTYSFDRLADDVDELRKHLGYESMPVLAHSMGGFVALSYALRHPERCQRLALVATTPRGVGPQTLVPILRALGPLRTAKALTLAVRFAVLWSWRRASSARTEAMYAPWTVTQEPRKGLRAMVAAAYPELPVDNDNASHLMRSMRGLDLRNQLGGLRCPALVLYGSRDAAMVAGGRMLASLLPDAEIRVLPDVGHAVFLEAPAEGFGCIRDFLRPD